MVNPGVVWRDWCEKDFGGRVVIVLPLLSGGKYPFAQRVSKAVQMLIVDVLSVLKVQVSCKGANNGMSP